jgi:diguanylate cyclase
MALEERREGRREEGLRFARRIYAPRALGLAAGGLCIGGVLWENGAGTLAWLALGLSSLVWPHVACQIARRAEDPYRAELRNLTVDSALGGVWIAAMQFNLLPSVVILIMLTMDKMAIGGTRFLARCAGVLVLACAATAALNGYQVRPYTNMVQIIGSLPLLVFYPLVVGWTTYRLARRLREQNQILAEMSRTDGLSGLLNRRYWEEAVAAEFERCARTGACASLLMLDIDHFKSINDQYGHPAGDEVIRKVAGILRESLRGDDVPGRYGGEEFGVLLPDTPEAGAEVIAERIRGRIERAALGRPGLRATASIGIAEIRTRDVDYRVWISQADRALYAAKERGRNRSVRFQPTFTPRPEPT